MNIYEIHVSILYDTYCNIILIHKEKLDLELLKQEYDTFNKEKGYLYIEAFTKWLIEEKGFIQPEIFSLNINLNERT